MSAVAVADRGGLAALARTGLLLALACLAAALEAAPLGLGPDAPPSPDLLFCLLAYWALRAPEAAPVLLVFGLGLARDLLTDQPVGLGALTLVFAVEALKARRGQLARQPFAVEWLWVGVAAAAMALAQWLGVTLSLARPPYLSLLSQQVGATLLAYPATALLLRWVVRVRRQRSEAVRPGGERG